MPEESKELQAETRAHIALAVETLNCVDNLIWMVMAGQARLDDEQVCHAEQIDDRLQTALDLVEVAAGHLTRAIESRQIAKNVRRERELQEAAGRG